MSAIVRAVAPVPVVLQYAPSQTGTALEADTIAEIARTATNLVQVKVESTRPGTLITALANTVPPLTSVVGYAGVQMPDALRRGAVGVEPGCSFVELYMQVWRLWQTGRPADAVALHRRMLPYISYWMQGSELIIAAEKEISMRRGDHRVQLLPRTGAPAGRPRAGDDREVPRRVRRLLVT